MAFISLMTAVFWGQFSACQEQYSGYVDTYTCYSPGAMTAVAAFASLLFVLEVSTEAQEEERVVGWGCSAPYPPQKRDRSTYLPTHPPMPCTDGPGHFPGRLGARSLP